MTASNLFYKTAMGDTYKVKYCFDKQFKTSLKLINIIQNSAFNLLFPNVIYFTTNTYQITAYHFIFHDIIWTDAVSERFPKDELSVLKVN